MGGLVYLEKQALLPALVRGGMALGKFLIPKSKSGMGAVQKGLSSFKNNMILGGGLTAAMGGTMDRVRKAKIGQATLGKFSGTLATKSSFGLTGLKSNTAILGKRKGLGNLSPQFHAPISATSKTIL